VLPTEDRLSGNRAGAVNDARTAGCGQRARIAVMGGAGRSGYPVCAHPEREVKGVSGAKMLRVGGCNRAW